MVDVRDPLNPQFAGCFGQDGYVHDAQCVIYKGPDADYQGREICFCYNENTLTIVDVEDKDNMKMLSRVPYDNVYYTHQVPQYLINGNTNRASVIILLLYQNRCICKRFQGWLTEDQTYLLLNDELDEVRGPNPHTRSLIWNVEDLDKPELKTSFYSSKQATDHNLYVK